MNYRSYKRVVSKHRYYTVVSRALFLLVESTVRVLPMRLVLFVLAMLTMVPYLQASPEEIRLNQVGYATSGPKVAAVVSPRTWYFSIKNESCTKTFYTGALSVPKKWSSSAETLSVADFSDFNQSGTFVLYIEGIGASYPFTIENSCFDQVARGLVKAFYYQRSSTSLPPAFAGTYARAAGHPDNEVMVHPSAASDPLRPGARYADEVFASPKGWYDAGDYGKYVVNAGISTYQLLLLYEQFSDYFATRSLTIPESKNTLPDILDEIKWELDWLLTMQDPADGGVYHKITDKAFIGNLSPAAANEKRYFIGKGAAATFDFVAVLSVAYRIYKEFLPAFADSCLASAKVAWAWGSTYPDSTFRNPEDVVTGEYGDNNTHDEHFWAGLEMFIATGDSSYYLEAKDKTTNFRVPEWPNVALLGCYSMALKLNDSLSKSKIILRANELVGRVSKHPYHCLMDPGDYYWGSNAVAGNQGMVVLVAYLLTKEAVYLDAAIQACDYLLGRNATGYCFVTGYGSKSPMNPHHRPSIADAVNAPVPGFLVGGPNPGKRDGESCGSAYPLPRAMAYLDNACSFTTNEVAINWNSVAAFLIGGIDAILQSGNYDLTVLEQYYRDSLPPAQPIVAVNAIGADRASVSIVVEERVTVTIDVSDERAFNTAKQYVVAEADTAATMLTGLKPQTTYYIKVLLADAAGNVTTCIDSFATTSSMLTVASLYDPLDDGLTVGSEKVISFQADERFSANLLYAIGGSDAVTVQPFSRAGTVFEAIIPDVATTVNGIVYAVQLFYGADTIVTPQRALGARDASLTCKSFTTRNAYSMVSVPGRFKSASAVSLFSLALGDTVRWRYYGYATDREIYLPFDTIQRCRGGWLYHEEERPFTLKGDWYPPNEPVAVTLQKGWNCVGNPFPFPVYWDNTGINIPEGVAAITSNAAQQLVRRQLFFYNDSTHDRTNNGEYTSNRDLFTYNYNDTAILEPWKSCWVYANKEGAVCQIDPSPVRRQGVFAKRAVVAKPAWMLRLQVSSGSSVKGSYVIGRAEEASDGFDLYDTPMPPSPESLLKVALVNSEVPERTIPLYGDIRQLNGNSVGTWELRIESLTDLPLTIRWSRQGSEDIPLYLFDETSGATVAMERESEYTLSVSSIGIRKVVFYQSSLPGPLVQYPDTWSFTVCTGTPSRFLYEVPRWSKGIKPVTISMFDMCGRLVYTITKQHDVPGRFFTDWHGRTSRGRSVQQGFYIARISSGAFSKCVGFQTIQ